MADRQISVRSLIRHLEARRDKAACTLVKNGGEYKDFLIGTGKDRETHGLIQYLEKLIEKDPTEAELDEDDPPAPAPTPRLVKAMRRSKPRGWGS